MLGDAGAAPHNCWLTVIVVDETMTGWQAADLAKHLAGHDIETRPVWKPMHRQPVHAGRPTELTGVADRLYDDGLVLPGGSVHSDATVARVMRLRPRLPGGAR